MTAASHQPEPPAPSSERSESPRHDLAAQEASKSDPIPSTKGSLGINLMLAVVALALGGGGVWWVLGESGGDIGATRLRQIEQARRLLEAGRPDQALNQVADIRDDGPGAAEAMRIAGQALIALEDYGGARSALERSVILNPNQPQVFQLLAALALGASDAQRGADYLERAAQLDPNQPRTWRALGIVRHQLGESAASVDAYQKALALAPDDWAVRVNLIAGLLDLTRLDEASQALAQAEMLRPGDSMILGLRARLALAEGKLDEALTLADQCLQADPKNLDALSTRARLAIQHDDPHTAKALYQRLLEIDSENLGALQALAAAARAAGDAETARDAAQRHRDVTNRRRAMDDLVQQIAQNPDDPRPRHQLGLLAVEANQTTLAVDSFQAALMVDPKFEPAREQLRQLARRFPNQAPSSLLDRLGTNATPIIARPPATESETQPIPLDP